jgi:DNA polymerase-3 subunit gamma/tau
MMMTLSLFRKYRPETFAQFVGQKHVADTLLKAIAGNHTADAYLFTGPRGTGKTSTARLFAKAMLCEHPLNGEPDDQCEQCIEISAGIHPDVYELDAASRTGVENVREEIISRVAFAPIRGRYKIYIIDEVHMLSTAAFNALLKTLEEPPAHVRFILCTTDPVKVPQTIQSRCQRFDFHRFSESEIVDNLVRICVAEGFEYDQRALVLIAAHALGGMRDALVALEQISVYGSGNITIEATESMLGQVRPEQLLTLTGHIARGDLAMCLTWVADLVQDGTDIAQFVRELTRYLRDIYVSAVLNDAQHDASYSQERSDLTEGLSETMHLFESIDRLVYVLGITADLNQQLKGTVDDRLTFEMALIRMTRPETVLTLESLAARIAVLETGVWQGGTQETGVWPNNDAMLPADIDTEDKESADDPQTANSALTDEVTSLDGMALVDEVAALEELVLEESALEKPAPSARRELSNNGDAQRLWADVIKTMQRDRQNRLLGLVTQVRASIDPNGSGLLVEFPDSAAYGYQSVQNNEAKQAFIRYINQVYGQPLDLNFKLGFTPYGDADASASKTPAVAASEPLVSTPEQAESAAVASEPSQNPDTPMTAEELLRATFGDRIEFQRIPSQAADDLVVDNSAFDDLTIPLLGDDDFDDFFTSENSLMDEDR